MAQRWSWIAGLAAVLVACGDDDGGGNQNNNNGNENVLCGNGQLDGSEECDQGEANSDAQPDRCRRDCHLPTCGDGVVDPAHHELCDCGDGAGDLPPGCTGPNSDGPGTHCSTRCRVPVCGDGFVEGDETCEATDLQGATCGSLGFAGGDLECFNCQLWQGGCVGGCGNRLAEGDEACDGPDLSGKACTDVGFQWGDLGCLPTCELDLSGCWYGCGNGRLEEAELCDGADLGFLDTCDGHGFAGGSLACAQDCTYDFRGCLGGCGNGIVETGEPCDDGNQPAWDGCSNCTTTEFRVNATLDVEADRPSVAMASDGRLVVAWVEADGNGYRILARPYPATGSPPGQELLVSSSQTDLLSQPAVALADDGRFVVVWTSADDGSGSGVYGRRFAADGLALSTELQVNTNITGNQQAPAVAMAGDGRFVVAWQGPDIDGSDDGISAQRFDATGAMQGTEILVNTAFLSSQISPSVAMGGDGRFVVVWATTDWQPSGYGIFAQRFDAAGITLGGEIGVHELGDEEQRTTPSVALGGDYRFVVVWKGENGGAEGVLGRRFDANGVALSSELVINVQGQYEQDAPRVGMASDGRFVVAWQRRSMPSNYSYVTDVYGQRYTPDGQALGTEFQMNVFTRSTYPAHLQRWPAAAMAGDGRFVVTWRSEGQEGTDDGPNIYAQRYAADGTARGLLP